MFATINAHRVLIVRLLPLAAVVLFLALLVPADFAAFADIARQPAAPVANPVRARSVPAPAPIKPVITMGASAPQSAEVATASPVTPPSGSRPWVTTAQAAEVSMASQAQTSVPTPEGARPARVASAVNLRSSPSKTAASIIVLQAGTEVRVAEAVRGWVHVYTEAGEGWIYSTYLAGGGAQMQQPRIAKYEDPTSESPSPPSAKKPPKGRLQVQSAVTVRADPGGEPLYQLEPGEQVRIAEVRGKWARIVSASGESGWIRLR